jgi:hypothetical protein
MLRIKSSNSKQANSNYQSLYLWASFLLGMISLGIVIWNRRSIIPLETKIHSFPELVEGSSHIIGFDKLSQRDNCVSTYQINFPSFASSLALGAVAYQLSVNSPAVALLVAGLTASNIVTPVSAQLVGLAVKVPQFSVSTSPAYANPGFAVAQLSSGEWLASWSGDGGLAARRFAANNSALGSEFQVNMGQIYGTKVINLASGQWAVVWDDASNIFAYQIAADGSFVGSKFQVNTGTQIYHGGSAGASLSDNSWVVTWYAQAASLDSDIYARRFAVSGTPMGNDFLVNQNTTGSQVYSDIVGFPSGGWVIVWDSGDSQDMTSDIYASRYSSAGNILGNQFRINTKVSDLNQDPSVACLTSGEWMVAWLRTQVSNLISDIYVQRFAADGTFLGGEIKVNSNNTASQVGEPSITALSSDGWAVAWSESDTSSSGIFVQLLASNGSFVSSAFQLNNQPGGVKATSLSSENLLVIYTAGGLTPNIDGSILSTTVPITTTTLPTTKTPTTTHPTTVGQTKLITTASVVSQTLPTTLIQPTTTTPAAKSSMSIDSSASTAAKGSMLTDSSVSTTDTASPVNDSDSTLDGVSTSFVKTNSQAIPASGISPTTTAVIGAAVGVGATGLAICLGVVGFYACRKKTRANKNDNLAGNEVGVSLQRIDTAPSAPSKYTQIDETKKSERQYDDPPKFNSYEQPNSGQTKQQKYRMVDETRKPIHEYDQPVTLQLDESTFTVTSATSHNSIKPRFV